MPNSNLLSGIRLLDLTQMLAGPYATMLLADIGAEVIKIEEPSSGDRTRTMGPYFVGGESAYFISINRNKKSLSLNLKCEKGLEIFYRLVKTADVVFDNFRPGVLQRLKCDYETLKNYNPKIICCSISAFGQTGPYREMPAFDLTIQALGGAMSITGEPGREPVRMGIPMGDLAGAMFAAYSVVAALFRREQSGIGARIDISLLDALVSMHTYVAQYYLVSGIVPQPIGSAHQSVVPYQAFKTSDGYIVIAVYTDKFWTGLCEALQLSHLADDPRFCDNEKRRAHRAELIPLLANVFSGMTSEEVIVRLRNAGVPCAPINPMDKVLTDPQLLARNMIITLDIEGYGKLKTLGNPVKVDGIEERFVRAPKLGEHTEELLMELGYSREEIADLKSQNVI